MELIHKFNGGLSATLCNKCGIIITKGLSDDLLCSDCKRYIYWKCSKCGSHHKSDTKVGHQMDGCSCNNSFVDAEEFYSRWLGDAIESNINEYEEWKKTQMK